MLNVNSFTTNLLLALSGLHKQFNLKDLIVFSQILSLSVNIRNLLQFTFLALKINKISSFGPFTV